MIVLETTNMSIIDDLIHAAKQRGVSQKELALRAGIPAESISRAKRSGVANLRTLKAMAEAVDVQIGIVASQARPSNAAAHGGRTMPVFAQRHKSLVWSNANASIDTLLRAALVKPQFDQLLEAATEFGIDRLNALWRGLQKRPDAATLRAAPITNRILKHIQDGYQQAFAKT